ncbi:T123 protein [Hirschfeldia incana]|nr:T123 protein [Hirschfeldia incana]
MEMHKFMKLMTHVLLLLLAIHACTSVLAVHLHPDSTTVMEEDFPSWRRELRGGGGGGGSGGGGSSGDSGGGVGSSGRGSGGAGNSSESGSQGNGYSGSSGGLTG